MSQLIVRIMKTLFQLLLASGAILVLGANAASYKLDLTSPADLVLTHPYSPSPPSRVDIYRTGPRVWIDEKHTPVSLSQRSPQHSVTNHSDIKTFVSALRQRDKTARVTNAPTRRGYTYHLLLFHDD